MASPNGMQGKIKWQTVTVIAEGVAQIGFVIVVIILAALGLGLWMDSHFGTRPWFTLGLVLASIPVSLVVLVRVAMSVAMRAAAANRPGEKTETETTNEK